MTDLLTTAAERSLADRFTATRMLTESLAAPLSAEDQTVQSMPDVSPTKWHRAHTTWFFETFLLDPGPADYRVYDPGYGYLFNSYYEGVGARHPRPNRGLVTRPGIEEIADYRRHVDEAMTTLLERATDPETIDLVELGVQHEQQHQELLLMDIKHVLSQNPMLPPYDTLTVPARTTGATAHGALSWTEHRGGVFDIGRSGDRFSFDNELPRHPEYLGDFSLCDRPVSCGQWLSFMDDGGYRRPELWLFDGWATVQSQGWDCPLYWSEVDGTWYEYSLGGPVVVDAGRPVCHVSYYEADAFARWAGFRLPTEAEWEVAASTGPAGGRFLDQSILHPVATAGADDKGSLFGDVWQWTSSAYAPYPGFEPAPGTVGEYNGKFMVNQYVLRGGSCATPPGHVRASYRNFFPPSARWAFSGLRLARTD
ncbi:MAG: ergothioneine biosynthesis protein EgtB [Acidimicrobiales bacterium]